nr:hypothetical protein L203_03344 [Cryptococcus depauperatus CBS 7841]
MDGCISSLEIVRYTTLTVVDMPYLCAHAWPVPLEGDDFDNGFALAPIVVQFEVIGMPTRQAIKVRLTDMDSTLLEHHLITPGGWITSLVEMGLAYWESCLAMYVGGCLVVISTTCILPNRFLPPHETIVPIATGCTAATRPVQRSMALGAKRRD